MFDRPLPLTLLLVALSVLPAAIYLDATDHAIGKTPPPNAGISAGAWAAWVMIPPIGFMGIIGYLINRSAFIRRAAHHPVIVPRTRRLITCLLILLASSILTPYWWLEVAVIPAD